MSSIPMHGHQLVFARTAVALALASPLAGSIRAADGLQHPANPPALLSAGLPWEYARFQLQIADATRPLEGRVRMRRPDGRLAAEGRLRMGRVDGAWTLFSDDEQALASVTFRAGVPHGSFRTFHPSEKRTGGEQRRVRLRAELRRGEFVGSFTVTHRNGLRLAQVYQAKGQRRDPRAWNREGERLSRGEAEALVVREIVGAQTLIGLSRRILERVVESSRIAER